MKCQWRPLGQWSGCAAERVTFLFKACGRCSLAVQGQESPHWGRVLPLPVLPLPGPAPPEAAACGGPPRPKYSCGVSTLHARPRMGMGALPSVPSPRGALPGRGRQCQGQGSLREDRRGRVRLTCWQASHPVLAARQVRRNPTFQKRLPLPPLHASPRYSVIYMYPH